MSSDTCKAPTCERRAAAKGYCNMHYNRWRRHGDPATVRTMVRRGSPLRERLEMRADRSAGPDGCWLWTGCLGGNGYAPMQYEGRTRYAHVWAYVHKHGEPPADRPFVCHTCDNRRCVNPAHLYAGTHQQNMDDKVERHRQARHPGESNAMHKLTDEQVYEIRDLQGRGFSTSQVAQMFGVSQSRISPIWNRKSWAHLPERTTTDD